MSNVGYVLVFEGELASGKKPEEVKANLSSLFRLSEAKIDALFARGRGTLKRNLTLPAAQYMQKLFADAGMVVTIYDSTTEGDAKSTPEPEAAAVTTPVASESSGTSTPDPEGTEADSSLLSADALEVRELPFTFSGEGKEYFRIWIVNVLLSIATLGIYSAWAKVRTNRYFYGNTRIDGQAFSYLADPVTILKGRLIAAALFIVYFVAGEVSPLASMVIGLLFLPIFPWMVVRAMKFRNQVTAYRYVNFGFDGTYAQAVKAFIGWPLLGLLTFGLMMPYAIYKQKAFLVGNSRYGATPFKFHATGREYFNAYLTGGALIIVGGVAASFVGQQLTGLVGVELAGLATLPLVLIGYLLGFAYISATSTNILYNGTLLEEQSFSSTMTTMRLAGIQLGNWLLIALTLGLAYPWAKVRMARYKAATLSLLATAGMDRFVAAQEEASGSFAEGLDDVFDLDVGL